MVMRKLLLNGPVRRVLTRLRNWGIKWSLWPPHLVTACCGVEFGHAFASIFDAERFGMLPMFSLRQSNTIVIEGTITYKMAKFIRYVYEQMPEPKYVIAMGSCAMKGGVFYGSYHMVPAEAIVNVDAYVAGCPPTPEALLRAVQTVQRRIDREELGPKDSFNGGKLRLRLGPLPLRRRVVNDAGAGLDPKPSAKPE